MENAPAPAVNTDNDNDIDPILERLGKLYPKLIDLNLDRVKRLLDKLGQPHLSLPPVVHVAGTNAKGSVIAMMRAALEAGDYKVHVHTSPHLVRFNERIRLGGKLIGDEALKKILEECETENAGDPITFFEITTVAAMLAFSRNPADIVLLESGLGGRLDATNVVPDPILTIITPVSLDHQQFLGGSLAEIAGEKAGILKSGVPCVVAEQPAEALDAIEKKATEIGAPLIVEGRDWTPRQGPKPSLEGPHQAHNAGIAVAALERLKGFDISGDAIIEGFGKVEWPARLQHLKQGALAGLLGPDMELWLDGGHNEAAAAVLAGWLETVSLKPLHVVMGMLNSKNPGGFLQPLKPHIDSLYTVPIPGEAASLGADELAAAAGDQGIFATPVADVAGALGAIRETEIGPARVLITGSLYLAGKVLAENGWKWLESG